MCAHKYGVKGLKKRPMAKLEQALYRNSVPDEFARSLLLPAA